MKAILWTKYGPPEVLQPMEVDKPIPKDNEVLIRTFAAGVNAGDTEMRRLKFPLYLSLPMRIYVGFVKPARITILGMDLAGEIEALGKDVKLYKAGDQVFGTTGFRFGAYAEYICLPEMQKEMGGPLAIMPANMSYAEAAAVPTGGLEALHFLRKGNVQSGEKILINGAGGSIGTFAVQLAKHIGAEVTAVDSTAKMDLLQSIGADHVIDYTQVDFTKGSQTYDVIFDVVGKGSFFGIIHSLTKNGRYLIANPKPSHMLLRGWISMWSSKKVIMGAASQKVEDLIYLRELIEAGEIRSVIDRRFLLEQTAAAHRYVETGQKLGNVVIIVGDDKSV